MLNVHEGQNGFKKKKKYRDNAISATKIQHRITS